MVVNYILKSTYLQLICQINLKRHHISLREVVEFSYVFTIGNIALKSFQQSIRHRSCSPSS